MPLPCCKKPRNNDLRDAIAKAFGEAGEPNANVQGFLDSICDKLGCARTRKVIKSAVTTSLPKSMSVESTERVDALVENLFTAIESCSVITIIMTILQLLGAVSGRRDVTVPLDDLGDCVGNLQQVITMIQQILDLLNGGGGGNPCGCPGGTPTPKPPGNPGFNPADPGDNRGCP